MNKIELTDEELSLLLNELRESINQCHRSGTAWDSHAKKLQALRQKLITQAK